MSMASFSYDTLLRKKKYVKGVLPSTLIIRWNSKITDHLPIFFKKLRKFWFLILLENF